MATKNAFSFSADCKTLENCLKKVISVVEPTAAFFIGFHKKTLCVYGLGVDTFAMIALPNSESSSSVGIFGFTQDTLIGLIKNRAVMNFEFTGSECKFAQVKGKYSGDIPVVQVTDDQKAQIEARLLEKGKTAISLPAVVLAKIKTGIAATSIKDVYQNTMLLNYVTLTGDGGLTVSSFDSQHFGLYREKLDVKGTEFRTALPQTHFSIVDSIAAGTDVKFSVTERGLRATGKGFVICLPAMQSQDSHYTMVATFLKSLPKHEYECKCEVAKLIDIANNLFALYKTNTNFAFQTKGDVVTVGLSGQSGSASDSLRVVASTTAAMKFSVDPRLLIDILNLAKSLSEVTLRVVPKVVTLSAKIDTASVFLACSRIE